MRALISYDRYTELLSKRIHRTITPPESEDLQRFETEQPKVCPGCNARVRSQFMPLDIDHDIERCQSKPLVNTTTS